MAPTTDDKRLPTILRNASGFLYFVSILGITGTKAAMLDDVKMHVDRVKLQTDIPIGVGFGIRTAQQAANISSIVDAVVVGSALIDVIYKNLDKNGEVKIGTASKVLSLVQELSTAVQYNLNTKIFILNNSYMGMVRQWQQLLHGNRISESYSDSLPDFVRLAEAYGATGIRSKKPADLDDAILKMIDTPGPVIFDCVVANLENCFPMIPSGKAHNDMLLGENITDEEVANAIDSDGKIMV